MKGALEEYRKIVEDGGVPQLRLLARAWNVPKSTLHRRAKGNGHFHHTIGRKPLINLEDEAELAEVICTLEKRGFPLMMVEIQKLDWDFLKRNKNLSIRKPEVPSASRAAGFNPTLVKDWFNKYKTTTESLGLENAPDHIWN